MATIFEQLEQGLSSTGITGSVGDQVQSLTGVANALTSLAQHPPSSIGDFTSALTELPLPHLDAAGDLLQSLGSIQHALPSDLGSVTQDLTSGLGSIGGSVGDITTLLGNALKAIEAVAKLSQVDLRCQTPAAPPAPAAPPPAGPPPPADPPPAAPPAPNPAATAPLDKVDATLALFPDTVDTTAAIGLLANGLDFPARDSLFPVVAPILDDLRDPLTTLTRWQTASNTAVKNELKATLTAAAALVQSQLDGALASLHDAGELSLPTDALGTAAAGIIAQLGELKTAIAGGDVSGTGQAVTALNGFLDDLAAITVPDVSTLEPKLGDVDGALEDALVLLVNALNPSSSLDFLKPLSNLVTAGDNPMTEFQQWLGTFVSWLQDVLGALDLSAVKAPLQTAADAAHQALDAFDQAIAGVTVTVQELFNDVESLIDKVDTAGLVSQVEDALHQFETQLTSELTSLFSPVRDAIHDAVGEIDGAVDSFDPSQVVNALQDVMTQLEGVLNGAASAVQEIGTTLQQAADQVQNVSFEPIVGEVVKDINDVTDQLKAIDTSQLAPPLQIALQGALAVLPEDLTPVTDPLVDDFDQAVEQSAIPALDSVRNVPQQLLDNVKQFEPATLIGDALSQPFQQLIQQLNAFAPSSLLDPVKQELDALKQRLQEHLDPAQLLQPLHAPFQQLLDAFDSLKPEELVKPLQDGIDAATSAVFAAIPVDDAFAQVDLALAKVQDVTAIGDRVVATLTRAHGLLAGFEDAPAQTTAWLETALAKVDAAGALTTEMKALGSALDQTKAAALTTRIDGEVDAVLTPLTTLDPHGKLASIILAKNAVGRAALDALPDSAEKTAIATVLDRFDPLSPAFGAPFETLRGLATALTGVKTDAHALLTPDWDATYTGPDGLLGDLVGAQPGASVRDVVEQTFAAPLNAIFALTEPVAEGVDAVLTEVKKLVDELDAKIASLLTGPGSLGDVKNTIESLVDRLHHIDLGFLTTSLQGLFADVRSKIAALDPANLAQAVSADFAALLDDLDLSQVLPDADVKQLDDDYKAVITKLSALDPKKLVVDVVQPVFDQDVKPILDAFDLSKVLDAVVDKLHGLKDELKTELGKVNDAYKQLRAAIPQMSLGDLAGAAAGAAEDLAGAVGIGL